jgi:hypothetical protein
MTVRVLTALLLGALLAGPHARQQDDLFTYTPEGWEKWRSSDGQWTLWLPEGATPGGQETFLLLASGNQGDDWLPTWLGGAVVDWQGELTASGLTWSGKLAGDEARRGLVAVSESNDWTLGVLAPAGEWEARAADFNAILRGEP